MFSSYIMWYLFFAGAGSGAYTLAALFSYVNRFSPHEHVREYLQIARGGFLCGPLLVLFSVLFLLFDLGSPHKAYLIFVAPTFSVLSVGAWLILLFVIGAALLFFIRRTLSFRVARTFVLVLEAATFLFALGVMCYTGVFISSMPSLPFLNSPVVIPLFIASSFSTGAAVITLFGFLNQQRKSMLFSMRIIPTLDLIFIAGETVFLLALFIMALTDSNETARVSALELINGESAPLFWGLVVGGGLIVPGCIGVFERRQLRPQLLALSALLLLIGGLALRYCLTQGGFHISPPLFL
jgi:formate-dependent nitrite reductase membrane component NrfD